MVNNKLKVGLGLLTVLATPIAVNSLTSSEVHAAEQKTAVVEKSAIAEKTATESKQNVAEKPAVAEKSDNKAVVADKKTTEKLADNEKTEAIGKQEIVEKSISEEKQSESVKQEEILKNTLPKEGGKPSDGKEEDKTGYDKGIFYDNGKLANWWYDDGQDWYFFQNGKKHTGEGKDNAGNHYFVNGKYANGYQNETYYVKGSVANWWYDDGTAWYFFQNGKKHTGEGKDNAGYHYFANGKYANGIEKGIYYVKGKAANGYQNGTYYVEGKAANWWYDDGTAWYFFQNGKKHTGEGKDNAGYHYFANGKYANGIEKGIYYVKGKAANGYQNGTYYVEGKAANWWYDDGTAWYFFQNGKKYTGEGKDNAGYHYFVNGKYENNVPALNMPQYYQSDARWGKKVYGLANLDDSGCVPTSLAMAFSGLGKSVTPIDVADVIYNNTNAFNKIGMGTTGAGADYAIKYYNFKNTVIKTKSQLAQALQSGNPVLALVGKGYFVKKYYNSHAVILSGYQNGETKALDPDNAANTGKWYNVDGIWNQRSLNPLNAMLGGSFMLIEKK